MSNAPNRRVLLIDDTPSIHADFQKILLGDHPSRKLSGALADARKAFFGADEGPRQDPLQFELDCAGQGREGLEFVRAALREERPYALAFVDNRMPPGWDGVQTIKRLWEVDSRLQVVICTAYSDYSWEETLAELGQTDRLLILKKPFEPVEIRQLACALTEKWNAARRESDLIAELERAEAEQRAYASSLETLNQALLTSKATSDRSSEVQRDFMTHLSDQLGADLGALLERALAVAPSGPARHESGAGPRLVQTLGRVADLARLESGELALEEIDCDLRQALHGVVEGARAAFQARGLDLDLQLDASVPRVARCDTTRLGQAVEQLLDNALVNTQRGGVVVHVCVQPTGDWQRSRLFVRVQDTGAGMAQRFRGREYEPFVGDGPGLGLSVTKSLARLMGGDLSLESASEGGSVFQLSLDLGVAQGDPD